MAFMVISLALGLLFYILLGFGYSVQGLYGDDGKGNGNYSNGLYKDNGKHNGNYSNGLHREYMVVS